MVAGLALAGCRVRMARTSAGEPVGVAGALADRHALALTRGQWFSAVSSTVTR
jgi:hypothetical protein